MVDKAVHTRGRNSRCEQGLGPSSKDREMEENPLLSKWGCDFWKNRLSSPGMVPEALEQLRGVLMGAVTGQNGSVEMLVFT